LAVHRSVAERLAGADRLRAAGQPVYSPASLADSYVVAGQIKPSARVIG
jgi:hypothetical protein